MTECEARQKLSKEILPFYSEVRINGALIRKEFEGYLGAVVGVSDDLDNDGQNNYAVKLDCYDNVITFCESELTPTGSMRDRNDYFDVV